MNTQCVIEGLQTLVVFYTELLLEKFWLRAKEMLESVFTDDSSSFEGRREAISEAIRRAFQPGHWQTICECAAQNHLLLGHEIQPKFFSGCDTDALVWFATDEDKGLIPVTLSQMSVAEDFDGGIYQRVHLSLSTLQQLATRDKGFNPVLLSVAEVLEGYCIFLGNNSPQLKKRFDEILGQSQSQEVKTSAPAPAKTAAAPPTPAKPGQPKSAVPPHNGGAKPGKPTPNGESKPKQAARQPRSGVFADVLKTALKDGHASTQTAPTA